MDNQYSSTAFASMPSQPPSQQHFAGFQGMPAQYQQPPTGSETSTLPPLQHQSHSYSHLPPLHTQGQHTASPHTPQTPVSNSAVSQQGSSNFSAMPTPVTSGSMPPPSTTYMSAPSGYPTSQAPGHPSTAAGAGGSSLPPAHRLQDLRPMPSTASYNSPLTPFPPFNANTTVAGQHAQYIPSQEPEPTHVVGSQGRRGILPSIPGRPPPPSSVTTTAGKSMIPQKDADGKFPCPHCNKTYLHAKHLKRHLLRHTGDRPYMCHLCKDTFSRSDILKRHFQKCSVRRGNPTGQNHLAGQRRNTGGSVNRLSISNGEGIAMGSLTDPNTPTGYANGSMPNTVNGSPSVNGDQHSYASSIASLSARSSRANSLIQPGSAFGPNGEHPVTSGGYQGGIPAYTMRPHSASNPVPSSYGYGTQPPTSNMYASIKADDHGSNNYTPASGPMQGRGPNGNMDWNAMFSGGGGQENFMPQGQQDHSQIPKPESGMDGQSFESTESYNNAFLNNMQSQGQAYADDGGVHRQHPATPSHH